MVRGRRAQRRWARRPAPLTMMIAVALLLVFVGADRPGTPVLKNVIGGPYARLLAESVDLGPARVDRVQLTAALNDAAAPVRLTEWADRHGLSVRWRAGDPWAVVEGAPDTVADALDVAVHDYRGKHGQVFYASPQQPVIPAQIRGEVGELGRILGYTPYHMGVPPLMPRDVPDGGMLPTELVTAYNFNALAAGGFTGKGITVVVFGFDGFDQRGGFFSHLTAGIIGGVMMVCQYPRISECTRSSISASRIALRYVSGGSPPVMSIGLP